MKFIIIFALLFPIIILLLPLPSSSFVYAQFNPPPSQYNCAPNINSSTANGTLWGCVIKQVDFNFVLPTVTHKIVPKYGIHPCPEDPSVVCVGPYAVNETVVKIPIPNGTGTGIMPQTNSTTISPPTCMTGDCGMLHAPNGGRP